VVNRAHLKQTGVTLHGDAGCPPAFPRCPRARKRQHPPDTHIRCPRNGVSCSETERGRTDQRLPYNTRHNKGEATMRRTLIGFCLCCFLCLFAVPAARLTYLNAAE
jgi:hypothetical protein